jgi:hypothetical protein
MTNKLIFTLLIVALICALLILRPAPATAADTCPSVATAWTAQLDIVDGTGRHYLIDPLTQGLPSHVGNVAKLQYGSFPPRWLVNGRKIVPSWKYVYHITYWRSDWMSAGEAWFATHPANSTVYFYFVMPEGEPDHPCEYGSIDRAVVDELLRPRK